MPTINAIPAAVPVAARTEKASRKIEANTSGSLAAFTPITNNPPAR